MSKTSGSKKTGGNTSSVTYAPARVRRMEQAKQRQEEYWASLAGPVEISWKEPGAPRDRGITRAMIRKVPCPTCGAGKGELCNTQGMPRSRNHITRMQDAQEAQGARIRRRLSV